MVVSGGVPAVSPPSHTNTPAKLHRAPNFVHPTAPPVAGFLFYHLPSLELPEPLRLVGKRVVMVARCEVGNGLG